MFLPTLYVLKKTKTITLYVLFQTKTNNSHCDNFIGARVYSNVSNLRQHMRLIHNPTSVCCPLCQKSFTSDLYLKRHYLSMHGSTVPTQTVSGAQANNPNATQLQTTQSGSGQPQSSQAQQVNFDQFSFYWIGVAVINF